MREVEQGEGDKGSEGDIVVPAGTESWKKRPTLLELKQHLTDAKSDHTNQVSKIDTWLDNLNVLGAAKIKVKEGNSSIVPKLIRKQAEWRYASLSEPFLSTTNIFKADPVTAEDKKAAIQNQLILNHQFNTKIDKVEFIDEYVRTAVDEGTVIVKLGWEFDEIEETVRVPTVRFDASPEHGPMHEELHAMYVKDPSLFMTDVPDELKEAHKITMETGIPYLPTITGYTEKKETRVTKNQPTVEICNFKNTIIDPTCLGKLDKAGFIIYSFETSLSSLEKDGRYHSLDLINPDSNSPLGDPDHATETVSNFNFNDKARKKFVAFEYWGYWDINGTGVVEPIVATWVGDTLIRMDLNPYPDKKLPFVKVHYLPVRRSIYGEPDGSLLEDNQKIMGAVTRGVIDVMAKSANGQRGVRKDMLDATNRRKFNRGDDYEFNQTVDPRQGFYSHVYPEIPSSAAFMLQWQNNEAESLTGVKAFTDGISSSSLGEVAAGIRGALDAASKRELGILRRLAGGIVAIGRKFISMNAVFLNEEEVVRVTNDEFVPIRRDDLAGDIDLSLAISTAEEDNAKAQELAFMMQTMGNSQDPNITLKIQAEIFRLRKMPDLAQAIEDYKPEPDPMAQRLQELELLKLEAEIKLLFGRASESEADAILSQARSITEGARANQIKSDADLKNLDFVEQESGVKQERDLQRQKAQSVGNIDLEREKHSLKARAEDRSQLQEYLKKVR